MSKVKSVRVNNDGMEAAEAESFWDQVDGYAAYSFNKSHAAEYSLISYQCMWLKVNYPVEFYAAALSTVDEKKLQVLVHDAARAGIKVMPPDINISTNEFVIGNDATLFMPFNRIKGVSDKGGQAIIKARKAKPFSSIEEFQERVERRLVNVRVVESLNTVGAFARIDPGQRSSTDVTRLKEQMVLLPGLMTGVPTTDRALPVDDPYIKARLVELTKQIDREHPGVFHAKMAIGGKAKFMAVMDAPGHSEEMERMFSKGESFQYTSAALLESGLNRSDGYWTGLVKRRKSGTTLSPAEIKTYSPYLAREIELMKPPLIVTLGSNASRYFVPELKGDMMDHLGRTFYNEKLDAMILIGFNPNMCHFAPERIDLLVDLFETVKSIVMF